MSSIVQKVTTMPAVAVNLNLATSLGSEAASLSKWLAPAGLVGGWMIYPIVAPSLFAAPSTSEGTYKFVKEEIGVAPTLA